MKQLNRLLAILALVTMPAWAGLPDSSVSYVTAGEPLYVVAAHLERTLGVRIVIKDLDLNQTIKGKYLAGSGHAFVENFASRNRFTWIMHNNQLILAPEGTDLSPKKTVTSKEAAPSSFSKIVFDPKDPNKYGLMIFQVHNGSVEDRRISSGATGKVVKGVATLFGEFIGAPPVSPAAERQQRGGNVSQAAQLPKTSDSANLQNNLLSLFSKKGAFAQNGGSEGTAPAFISDANTRGVYADGRLNAILVRDKVAHFESYRQIVALLDRPADMVQLEAFIVDIQKSKIDQLGLNLGLGGEVASNLILSPFNSRSLLSKLKALEATGSAESLSVPSVVSLNNEQALFSSRQNFYISVAGAYDATVNQVTAETQLLVTPQIANESPDVPYNQRRVKLLINVQDAQANTTEKLPTTVENQIATQAVVRSGDTLVIGGQIVRKKIEHAEGLPGTTGASIFGRLFSERTTGFDEYVRVYIVRPQILGEDSYSANQVTGDNVANQLSRQYVK